MYLQTTAEAQSIDLESTTPPHQGKAYDLRNLNAFYFFIYAIIGWCFEVIYCFFIDGVFVNRGLLHGPYLPIYGFGAIIVLNLIAPFFKSYISLFIGATIICTALEYFTSWYMEAVFNVSLWDYSDFFLNINGRVCAWNSLLFGILALFVVYIFQPFFNNYLHRIPLKWRPLLSVLLVSWLVVDFLFSAFSVQELAQHGSSIFVLFS